jgi:hypothetical protein
VKRLISLMGAGATALALTVTTALAGSGVGAQFNLGQTNSVDATSVLTGSSAGQLKVQNNSTAAGAFSVLGLISPAAPGASSVAVRGQNNGTGAAGYGVWGSQAGSGTGVYGITPGGIGVFGKHTGSSGGGAGVKGESAAVGTPGLLGVNTAGGTALALLVNAGQAPFTVNSSTKVNGLNADQLDGLDSTAFWRLTGNAGTSPATSFLGTTDAQPLLFKTNGAERMRVDSSGNVGLGTASPAEKLDVAGTVAARNSSVVSSEGFEGATFPPANWTTGPQNGWSPTTSRAYEGSASAQSTAFPFNATSGTSYIQLDSTMPAAGRIDFHWAMVQNPSTGSSLFFCIDEPVGCGSQQSDRLVGGPSAGFDWVHYSTNGAAGHHTFTWLLVVTGSSANTHQALLDSVTLETVGVAMKALGHAEQSRSAGGWAKALVRQYGGALQHCYNSQGANPDTCDGFSVASGTTGIWVITFPFEVDDRFVSVSVESADGTACCMTSFNFVTSKQIAVRTWTTNGTPIDPAFTVFVF